LDQNNKNDNNYSDNSEIIQSDDNVGQKIFLPKKNNMIRRMIGVAIFNVNIYEEINNDSKATIHAFSVVLIASLCAGLGAMSLLQNFQINIFIYISFLFLLQKFVIFLFIFALGNLFSGSNKLNLQKNRFHWKNLIRTLGFAQSPAMIVFFGFFSSDFYLKLTIFTTAWVIITSVIAVRETLGLKSNKFGVIQSCLIVIFAQIPALIINFIGQTVS
jgi:hypothetical protein